MSRIYSDWVEIKRPCRDVDRALLSFDTWSEWKEGYVSVSIEPGQVLQIGTQWTEVRNRAGRELTHVVELTDYVKNESISMIVDGEKGTAGKGALFIELRMVDYDGSTTLHLDSKQDTLPWFKRLTGRKSTGADFLELWKSDLDRLKAFLEQPVTDRDREKAQI